jgi:hypothetical protein
MARERLSARVGTDHQGRNSLHVQGKRTSRACFRNLLFGAHHREEPSEVEVFAFLHSVLLHSPEIALVLLSNGSLAKRAFGGARVEGKHV